MIHPVSAGFLCFARFPTVSNYLRLNNSAIYHGMNCRPFAVIAVVLCGLVPAIQLASAGSPTHQRATATATILSGVSTIYHHEAERVTSGHTRHGSETVRVFYIDADGFITNVASPQRWKVIIIDMP